MMPTNSFTPDTAQLMQTERLTMRPVTTDMLPELHQLFIDPLVRRFLLDDEVVAYEWTANVILTSQESFEKNSYGLWALQQKNAQPLIGFCGYWRFDQLSYPLQLIYGLLPAYWGKGWATEAAQAMIAYGFEQVGFSEIVSAADIPNSASFKVMERLGMRYWKREDVIDYYKLER